MVNRTREETQVIKAVGELTPESIVRYNGQDMKVKDIPNETLRREFLHRCNGCKWHPVGR